MTMLMVPFMPSGLPDKEVAKLLRATIKSHLLTHPSCVLRAMCSMIKTRSSGSLDVMSSGLAAKSRLDHCSCLLEQKERGGDWKVVRIFSVVELKIGTDNDCVAVSVDNTNAVRSVDKTSGCGAVAQVLMYTFGWVLPNHAEFRQLQDLAWATIVGKKKKKAPIVGKSASESEAARIKEKVGVMDNTVIFIPKKVKLMPSRKYRWVMGKIFVPEKCGGIFEYSVTSCGKLDENDGGFSTQSAVSAFFTTLLFGLEAAKQLLLLLHPVAENRGIVPHPSSGKHVVFGKNELALKLRGKPIVGDPLLRIHDIDWHWSISQGEIFTGRANCAELANQASFEILNFNVDNRVVDVVVKVSSLAVHRYLNHPERAWEALNKISYASLRRKLNEAEKSNEDKKLHPAEHWDLFNVLLAVEKLPNALITVMADLSQDYKMLTPGSDRLSFSDLWSSFRDLVSRILFPLAAMQVIHPDIRPGWDVTSNILYVKNYGRGQVARRWPAMQLIDFDSLVVYSSWIPPSPPSSPTPNFKYMRRSSNSCYTFLWWQCVSQAFAWKWELSQFEMEKN